MRKKPGRTPSARSAGPRAKTRKTLGEALFRSRADEKRASRLPPAGGCAASVSD